MTVAGAYLRLIEVRAESGAGVTGLMHQVSCARAVDGTSFQDFHR